MIYIIYIILIANNKYLIYCNNRYSKLTCSISIIFNLVSMTRGYASPLTIEVPPVPGVWCKRDEDDEPVVVVVFMLIVDFDLFNKGGGGLRPLLPPPSVRPVTTAPTSPIADLIAPIPSTVQKFMTHNNKYL